MKNVLFRTEDRLIVVGNDGIPVGVPIKLNLDVIEINGIKVQSKLIEHEGNIVVHALTEVKQETITDEQTGESEVIKIPIMRYLPQPQYNLVQPKDLLKQIQEELAHLENVQFYCMEKDYEKLAEISLPSDPAPHEIRQRVRILNRWKRRYEKMLGILKVSHRRRVLSKVPG